MKKWLLDVLKRLGDLVIKLLAVKTIVAVVVTWVMLQVNPFGFSEAFVVAVVWCFVSGMRYAEKLLTLKRP